MMIPSMMSPNWVATCATAPASMSRIGLRVRAAGEGMFRMVPSLDIAFHSGNFASEVDTIMSSVR